MERLTRRNKGMSIASLRAWGILFILAGALGRGLLQNAVLGLDGLKQQQLLEAMNNPEIMALVTGALVLQALETCAIPIFAFMLVEGFLHTGHFKNYLLRMTGLALVSEIPFDLAMKGSFLDLSVQNPAIGMAACLLVLYFFRRYSEKGISNVLIKLCVAAAALVWMSMLRVDHGVPMVLMVCALWLLRKRPQFRLLWGAAAAVVCTVFSAYYLASPMGFLPVHLYSGERPEKENRLACYLVYPVLLLVIGLVVKFM